MSFKRFDTEDIVLSSEIITFPTWYSQEGGDTSDLKLETVVSSSNTQLSYVDFYSGYASGSESASFDASHSKALFSLAYAERYESGSTSGSVSNQYKYENLVFGQYRTLVLGDEDSEFRFGATPESGSIVAKSFVAMTVDRLRFREKLDPLTCRFYFIAPSGSAGAKVLAPDITKSERYIDAGRVYDLAEFNEDSGSYTYPESGSSQTSYGYFLPDIGVVLFNTDESVRAFYNMGWADGDTNLQKADKFKNALKEMVVRSQETVTSNYVFVRARNGEFNYSTNPSNITGSAGNIRWDVMVNQPQSFITTVGLYNDSNDLLAVAKLSRPLVKDFTKEALIRIKLDY